MTLVSFYRHWVPLILLLFSAFASANPVLNEDYTKYDSRITPSGERIELIEFFSYSCLGCFQLGPDLDQWYLRNLESVDLVLVPIVKNRHSESLARLYYALLALDKLAAVHYDVFGAIHDDGQRLWEFDAQIKWANQYDIQPKELKRALDSEWVSERVDEARELAKRYPISVTPTLIVDDVYWTTATMVQSRSRLGSILDFLIEKAIMRRETLTGTR
jgi:thiol:disulfide interchange protein DsbA